MDQHRSVLKIIYLNMINNYCSRQITHTVHCYDRYSNVKVGIRIIADVYLLCVGCMSERLLLCQVSWFERYPDHEFNIMLQCFGTLDLYSWRHPVPQADI